MVGDSSRSPADELGYSGWLKVSENWRLCRQRREKKLKDIIIVYAGSKSSDCRTVCAFLFSFRSDCTGQINGDCSDLLEQGVAPPRIPAAGSLGAGREPQEGVAGGGVRLVRSEKPRARPRDFFRALIRFVALPACFNILSIVPLRFCFPSATRLLSQYTPMRLHLKNFSRYLTSQSVQFFACLLSHLILIL